MPGKAVQGTAKGLKGIPLRTEDIEKMSFDELKLASQKCVACDLAQGRRSVVFGEGNPRAAMMLIGEGPGETEDATGLPFVGRAGQMLERALAENGLKREDLYITNVVKCRAADYMGGRWRNRPPNEAEMRACRRWLVPQIGHIRPRVILCIGAPAAKSLIKKDFKITAERGKYFPCEYARTAIATLHPAFILRQQAAGDNTGYALLVSDIGKAWGAAQKLIEQQDEFPFPTPHKADEESGPPQASLF